MKEHIVICEGVTKNFGSGSSLVRALRGVDLQLPYGALSLLVGPSGCGKTTLLSIIAGLYRPEDGSVEVLGRDLNAMSSSSIVKLRKNHFGFVFQQFNLLPSLTAAENAAVPAIISGKSRKKAVERAGELLAEMGLGERTKAFPNQLSGGQQQRVAIARAIINEPELILCDEPTASLDAESGKTIMELLAQAARQSHRSVIVVTHDPRVFDYADMIAKMEDGRIDEVHTDTPRDVLTTGRHS